MFFYKYNKRFNYKNNYEYFNKYTIKTCNNDFLLINHSCIKNHFYHLLIP